MKSFSVVLHNALAKIFASQLYNQFKTEYQTKPVIKYGYWVMLFTMAFYVLLVVSDESDVLESELDQLVTRLTRVEQVQAEKFWQERLELERENASQVAAKFWTAETVSLAKAQIQSYFASRITSRLDQSSINVEEPLYFGNFYDKEVFTVRAEIRGKIRTGDALSLFEDIAKITSVHQVDKFDIEFSRNKRVSLVINSYFFIAESP
jgi:hypothetical protein